MICTIQTHTQTHTYAASGAYKRHEVPLCGTYKLLATYTKIKTQCSDLQDKSRLKCLSESSPHDQ